MPSPSTIGVIACCVITGLTSAIAALAVREMVYGDTVPAEAYVLLASLPAAVVPSVAAVSIVLWERRQNMREPAQRLLTVLNRLDVNFTDIHDRAQRHVEVRTGRKPREAGDPYHAYVAFRQITANFKEWVAELKPDLLANGGRLPNCFMLVEQILHGMTGALMHAERAAAVDEMLANQHGRRDSEAAVISNSEETLRYMTMAVDGLEKARAVARRYS